MAKCNRSRSRSSTPMTSLQLYIALSDAQARKVMKNAIVETSWFGQGKCVSLKDNQEKAVESYYNARRVHPDWLLAIKMEASRYMKWSHATDLWRTPHVFGYRLYKDFNLNKPEIEYQEVFYQSLGWP